MMSLAVILAALSIVSPKDGELVPTLRQGQRDYLSGSRAERFLRMDNKSDRAKFVRIGDTQQPVRLEWSGPTNVSYTLTVMRESEDGTEESFALTNRVTAYITNLELDSTYLWMVKDESSGESAMGSFRTDATAPRLLRAEGVRNFRDLGGWKTADGRRVRENMLFRSAGLRFSSKNESKSIFRSKIVVGARRITDDGIATLRDEFKIKTDLELRTQQETAGMTSSVLGDDVAWHNVSFAAYDFMDNLVRGREPYARVFPIFTKRENYPILFHCSGGRDRTGTLAFLLNGLLGVDEDDLCRDWESSIFADPGMKFTSDNIVRLIEMLKQLPGNTLNEKIVSFTKNCGITDEQIAAFREIMLEKRGARGAPPTDVAANVVETNGVKTVEAERGARGAPPTDVAANVVETNGVKTSEDVLVSSFGYDPEDSTKFIQAALDSGAKKIVFDRQKGPWIAKPLFGRSNQEIVFRDGVELLAKRGEFKGVRDKLLSFEFCTNVVLRGEGEHGGTLRMWKKDYQDKSQYKPGEWRYTLALYAVKNARVENMSFVASGGDGICVAAKERDGVMSVSEDVTLIRCVCDDNHRQALTVGGAKNLLVEECVFKNTRGTPPEAGVDFEPDRNTECLVNCVMRRCRFEHNGGSGIEFYGQNLTGATPPISVLIDECFTIDNLREAAVQYGGVRETDFVGGEFRFRNCTFGESRGMTNAVFVLMESTHGGKIVFEDCDGFSEQFARRSQPMMDSVIEAMHGRVPKGYKVPSANDVVVVDELPGQDIALGPISHPGGGKFIFFANEGQVVRFTARQVTAVKGRTASVEPVRIVAIAEDGKDGECVTLPQPGFDGGEIVFKAPSRGFYRLIAKSSNVRFVLETSNVPVALDTTAGKRRVVGCDEKPFSLYVKHRIGKSAYVAMAGNWYYKFCAALVDPDGEEAWRQDLVESAVMKEIPGFAGGLWRVVFSKAEKPNYDWIEVNIFESDSPLFLTKEKTWQTK